MKLKLWLSVDFTKHVPSCILWNDRYANFSGRNHTHMIVKFSITMMTMFALLFSETISFFWQCLSLVDYYVPILFVELSTISPEQLCEKVNLCGEAVLVNLPKNDDACSLCHNIVAEILTKLTDPDRQVSINPLRYQIPDCCRNIPDHISPPQEP